MKHHYSLLIVVALTMALLAAAWSTALAAVSGGVVGNGTAASCTEAALATALSGGGSITFNCGAAPHTIVVANRKTINADTVLNGGNLITLSGSNGVFQTPVGKALMLQNLTLTAASSSTGSLENRGRLSLQNVAFKDNVRGLVNLSGGVADILGGLFQNNQPSGAIFNQGGTLTVANASFVANNAYNGGAIDNENGGRLSITDTVFDNNTSSSSGNGGAIYNGSNSSANIAVSQFISNGLSNNGGAIYNDHVTTLTRTQLISNTANSGGGIYSRGHLQIVDGHLSNNLAKTASGGAINHYNGTTSASSLTLVNTTLTGNAASTYGGAISFNAANGTLSLTSSTISGNTAQTNGGGLFLASAQATLKNVTLYNNVSVGSVGDNLQNGGGGQVAGTLTLQNTLVAAGSCGGAITDGGGNLQDAASTGCGASLTADPQLDPLQDNGGQTLTHALPANSPARDAGSNANCADFDQRGVTRPQNGTCDIGAFEYGTHPGVTSISPDFVGHGEPAFTLTVNGADFIAGSTGSRVLWDGIPLMTTFISRTQLAASVPANLIILPGRVTITVETPSADGGVSAGARTLVIGYRLYLPLVIR